MRGIRAAGTPGVGGPAAVPVAVGPDLQAPGEAGEGVRPEAPDSLLAEGLVGEQEGPGGGVRAGLVGDGAPEHAAQEPVDLECRTAGQLLQVAVTQAAAAGRDQAEELVAQAVVTALVGGQDLIELPLCQSHDIGRVGRDVQAADRARILRSWSALPSDTYRWSPLPYVTFVVVC
jgi:hypothetical protein